MTREALIQYFGDGRADEFLEPNDNLLGEYYKGELFDAFYFSGEINALIEAGFGAFLFDRVSENFNKGISSNIVLDLEDVDYIGFMGLKHLSRLSEMVRVGGGDLALIVGNESRAREVLKYAGLNATIALTDSLEKAVTIVTDESIKVGGETVEPILVTQHHGYKTSEYLVNDGQIGVIRFDGTLPLDSKPVVYEEIENMQNKLDGLTRQKLVVIVEHNKTLGYIHALQIDAAARYVSNSGGELVVCDSSGEVQKGMDLYRLLHSKNRPSGVKVVSSIDEALGIFDKD